jgi:hypothetical protein
MSNDQEKVGSTQNENEEIPARKKGKVGDQQFNKIFSLLVPNTVLGNCERNLSWS